MFGVGVSWIYIAIHDFGHTSAILASLLTGLFIFLLALYLSVIAWIIKIITKPILTYPDITLLLPIAWLGFEWFKSWFLTGFPWLELGISQVDGPLAGYTPIVGVLGVSWLVAMTAGLLLVALQSHSLWPALLVLILWTGGGILESYQWTETKGEKIIVSLIQGNVPQKMKWNLEQSYKTWAVYKSRTEQNWDSNLVIWPENAITIPHHQAKEYFLDPLADLARNNNTDILLGIPVMKLGDSNYFNSIMTLGAKTMFYHKRHLVPFGDYVPLQWLREFVQFLNLPMSSFIAGDNRQQLPQAVGLDIGISICYEDAFSTKILTALPKASILVNATNNAWYGNSLAPHQHLQISQNRALETGRPILRASTNGISAFINFNGQLITQSPQFEQAILTEVIQPRQGTTFYVNYQQVPILLISLLILLVWAYDRNTSNQLKYR